MDPWPKYEATHYVVEHVASDFTTMNRKGQMNEFWFLGTGQFLWEKADVWEHLALIYSPMRRREDSLIYCHRKIPR